VIYWRFRRVWRDETAPWLRCLGLTGVGWTVMMLIDSVASPVFNAAPSFPLLFALAAVVRSGQDVSQGWRSDAAESAGAEDRPALSRQ
jgi:hypothetical protein